MARKRGCGSGRTDAPLELVHAVVNVAVVPVEHVVAQLLPLAHLHHEGHDLPRHEAHNFRFQLTLSSGTPRTL